MTPELLKYTIKLSVGVVLIALAAWFVGTRFLPASAAVGTIEGSTNYPSEYLPEQIVCAEPVAGGAETCVTVPAGDPQLSAPAWSLDVAAGQYYVSARVKDPSAIGSDLGEYRAYYTKYVTCGLTYECKDHGKIVVTVEAGKTVTGITPYDWYIH